VTAPGGARRTLVLLAIAVAAFVLAAVAINLVADLLTG
jgi:hypothetical protein